MLTKFFFTSPLEQFDTLPIFSFFFFVLDFSFTSQAIILCLIVLFLMLFLCSLVRPQDFTYFIIPTRWQYGIERLNLLIVGLVSDNVKDKQSQYFIPLVYSVFHFLLLLNLFGLIPYSFTLTSHIIVTFAIALIVFIGIQIIGVRKHGMHYFALLLPPSTPIVLALLLVPIEFISFVFKPISLSIRLFANMMAGHTLLKVIAGFGYTIMGAAGLICLIHFIPLLILLPLFVLEAGVAVIQTFVFSILISIYLNEALNLH
jgi:ATP synthase subunit 6